jgi:hypothetical protein
MSFLIDIIHITENYIQFVDDGDVRSRVKMFQWDVSYNGTGQNNRYALASQWKKLALPQGYTFKVISHSRPVKISVFV